MGIFDSQTIKVPCPKCRRQHSKTMRQLQLNPKITCSCGALLDFDTSDLTRATKEAEKSLADLKRAFSRIGK